MNCPVCNATDDEVIVYRRILSEEEQKEFKNQNYSEVIGYKCDKCGTMAGHYK